MQVSWEARKSHHVCLIVPSVNYRISQLSHRGRAYSRGGGWGREREGRERDTHTHMHAQPFVGYYEVYGLFPSTVPENLTYKSLWHKNH